MECLEKLQFSGTGMSDEEIREVVSAMTNRLRSRR